MEASTLQSARSWAPPWRLRFSRLLRLQSDESLVALVQAGNPDAFEALAERYRPRLLAFCRYMVRSDEDAEDLVQETLAAAFTAMQGDGRPVHLRHWLYRIARNRCLNHIRHATAMRANGSDQEPATDVLDVQPADTGTSAAERVTRSEELHLLVQDVRGLPETQRTALVLREMHGLAYEQVADVMGTSVSSVKSLLVRARLSLVAAAQGREVLCGEARIELAEGAEGLCEVRPEVRSHVKRCPECKAFKLRLRSTNRGLAAIAPLWPLATLKGFFFAKASHTAASAGGAAASGAGAASGGGGSVAVGLSAGSASLVTKATLGLLTVAALMPAAQIGPFHQHGRSGPAGVSPSPDLRPRPSVRSQSQALPRRPAAPLQGPLTEQAPATPEPAGRIVSSTPEVFPGLKRSRSRSVPPAPTPVVTQPRGRPVPEGMLDPYAAPNPAPPAPAEPQPAEQPAPEGTSDAPATDSAPASQSAPQQKDDQPSSPQEQPTPSP